MKVQGGEEREGRREGDGAHHTHPGNPERVDLRWEDLVDDGLHDRVRLVRADGAHGTRDHR